MQMQLWNKSNLLGKGGTGARTHGVPGRELTRTKWVALFTGSAATEQLFGSDMTAVLQRYLKHEYRTKALHDAAKGL